MMLSILVIAAVPYAFAQQGQWVRPKDVLAQMPVMFGGYPVKNNTQTGPVYPDSEGVTVTYETEMSALLQYIPKELQLLKPEITVSMSQNRHLPWLGFRAYNLVSVSVPVIHSASSMNTSFNMVLWENMTEPILSGRENTGVAKVFADIDYAKTGDAAKKVTASWQGTTFLRFSTEAVLTPLPAPLPMQTDSINLRAFPTPGHANYEVYEWTHYPTDVNVTGAGAGKNCAIEWLPGRTNKTVGFLEMPTQFFIINALASLPVLRTLSCQASTSIDVLRNDLSGVLPSQKGTTGGAQSLATGQQGQWVKPDDVVAQMPVVFGGLPAKGHKQEGAVYPDTEGVTVTYKTEASALLPYIPKELQLLKPEITVSMGQNRHLPWLGFRAYNLVSVSVPVIHSASSMNTSFNMVLWENMTEPMLSGREFTGVNKVFADIDYAKTGDAAKKVTASWQGTTFLRFSTEAVLTPFPAPLPMQTDSINLRAFPTPGHANYEVYEWTHYPTDVNVTGFGAGKNCAIEWLPGRTNKTIGFLEMPTQFHIINALASLPVVDVISCGASTSAEVLRNDIAGVIGTSAVVMI